MNGMTFLFLYICLSYSDVDRLFQTRESYELVTISACAVV